MLLKKLRQLFSKLVWPFPKNDETDKNAYNHLTNEAHIDGLGCIDNKTLNFYALDMKTQTALANKIGLKIGVNEQHQEPKFVITSPNPRYDRVLESSRWWNIEFGEEIGISEITRVGSQ